MTYVLYGATLLGLFFASKAVLTVWLSRFFVTAVAAELMLTWVFTARRIRTDVHQLNFKAIGKILYSLSLVLLTLAIQFVSIATSLLLLLDSS